MKILVFAAAFLSAAAAPADLPLETTRTLRFDTEQVSWLSLDVHPNGKQIVFEALGDLYVLPIDGGTAQRLTQGPAFDSQPRYSPDGSQIIFVSDRSGSENLWLIGSDGSDARKLTKAKGDTEFASPSFSPDGEHVIASKTNWGARTFEVWAYHLKGGKGVALTDRTKRTAAQRHNAIGATYSPDGRYLYYARKQGGFGYNLTLPVWQIARRDLREGREEMLTATQGSAFRPLLSPDGNELVYATRHEQMTGLRVRDLNSGEDRWLAWPVEPDEQESRFTRDLFPGYAFSPDGQSLYTSHEGRIARIDMASGEMNDIPMRLTIDQALAPHLYFPYRIGQGPVKARLLQDPELSPDGSKLVFSAFMGIYVRDLNRGTTRRITSDELQAFDPTWSPSGRHIVFVSWEDGGGHLWRVRANGGRPRQLTEYPAHYTAPAYSPDGKRIVALRASAHDRLARDFDYGSPVGTSVVWLPSGGGPTTTITPANGLGKPHFGPDPNRVVLYLSGGAFSAGGSGGLVSMRFDGTDRRSLLTTTGPGIYRAENDVPSEDARLSPDGRHVLVQHANQLYLLRRFGGDNVGFEHRIKSPALPQAQLTDVGADHIGWSQDGKRVYWSVGHTFFQRDLDSIVFGDEEKDGEEDGDREVASESAISDSATDTLEQTAGDSADDTRASELAEAEDGVRSHLIELYLPRAEPEGMLALTNATVLTMEPGAEPIESATVLIDGARIAAVGQDVSVPEAAEVIDLSGRYVLPGYVDTHAHYRPLRGTMDRDNPAFLASLAYGVTTGIDVQPSTVDIIAYEDMIDAGLMLGPRALSTGPGVFSNNSFKSKAHAKQVLQRYTDHYGVRNLKAYLIGNRQQRQWLAQAAADLKLMPTTEGGLDMKMSLTHIIDGFSGNEHNLPLQGQHEDVVRLVAESQIAYTPTLLVTYGGPWAENWFYTNESPHRDEKLRRFTPYPSLAARTLRRFWAHKDEYTFDEMAEAATRIIRAGGKVGVGAHGQLQGLGYHWELWALASGGGTPMELLTAATRHGAEMIGVGQDIGTVTAGKLADLVVLDKDPLADIRNSAALRYVVKNGEMFEAETLNQIWPEARPLPEQWWSTLGPGSNDD